MLPYFIVLTAEVEAVRKKKKKAASEEYSNEDVFMCISKVGCQRHIHTAARVYTYVVHDYIALIVRANEPYAPLYIFHNFMSFDYFYAG